MFNIRDFLKTRPKPETFNWSKHGAYISSRTYVQEKLDGWRMTVFKSLDTIQAIGRRERLDYWKFLRFHNGATQLLNKLPPWTILDCEFVGCDDDTSTDIPTKLRNGDGMLMPFAVPMIGGDHFQSADLEQVNLVIRELGFTHPTTHRLEEYLESPRTDFIFGDFEQTLRLCAMKEKIEGFVLKAAHYDLWYKVKPTKTFDLVVTDMVDGDSKNRGKIGSLCVSAWERTGGCGGLIEVGKCGGLSDELRETDFGKLYGRVVEVEAQDVTRDGRLKFARLLRFRDDLEQCDADTVAEVK